METMNIDKEFVPYTESLELKELGFDEPCFGLYHNDKTLYTTQCKSHEQFYGQICSAPTYSQAFRWFRKSHNLFSSEIYNRGLNNGKIPIIHSYSFRILNLNNFQDFYGDIFNTYEEAELACLKKLIEIVKQKS